MVENRNKLLHSDSPRVVETLCGIFHTTVFSEFELH